MKEKGLLIDKKIGGIRNEFPLSEGRGIAIEPLIPFLYFLDNIKYL